MTAALARHGDLELYYETLGSGPPLVLLHGVLMTTGLMNDYPALLAAERQVIAVEMQGDGAVRRGRASSGARCALGVQRVAARRR